MDKQDIIKLIDEKTCTEKEAYEVFLFFRDATEEFAANECIDIMLPFHTMVENLGYIDSNYNKIMCNMVLIKAFSNALVPWRVKKYALEAYKCLVQEFQKDTFSSDKDSEETKTFTQISIAKQMIDLGEYFNSVFLFSYAASAFHVASEIYINTNQNIRECAFIKRKEIIAKQMLPKKDKKLPSEKEVREVYGEYSQVIVDVIEGKSYLKRDPIESSKEFQDKVDEVRELVLRDLEKARKDGVRLDKNKLFHDYMKSFGISWKSPERLNSKIRFKIKI